MLDQLCRDIQTRLDELLGDADRLRHALAALGSREDSAQQPTPATAPRARAATRRPARSRRSAAAAAPTSAPAKPSAAKPAVAPTRAAARGAAGATKSAVLAALAAGGDAMTAGQIAAAPGLGRQTVSTTLSRLVKTGEVTKAARGYQAVGASSAANAGAATSAEIEQAAG